MPKRILRGTIVSDKSDKTVVVKVERRFAHPLFKKTVRRSKKYKAHDEMNKFKIGDRVSIREGRPISKGKSWTVLDGDSSAEQGAEAKSAEKKPAAKKSAESKPAQTKSAEAAEAAEAKSAETAKAESAK